MVCVLSLEEAAIAGDNFRSGIAGHTDKSIRGEYNWIVRLAVKGMRQLRSTLGGQCISYYAGSVRQKQSPSP